MEKNRHFPEDQISAPDRPSRRVMIFWNDIRDRAFQKWRAAGEPPGDCTRFWLEAEAELLESA